MLVHQLTELYNRQAVYLPSWELSLRLSFSFLLYMSIYQLNLLLREKNNTPKHYAYCSPRYMRKVKKMSETIKDKIQKYLTELSEIYRMGFEVQEKNFRVFSDIATKCNVGFMNLIEKELEKKDFMPKIIRSWVLKYPTIDELYIYF